MKVVILAGGYATRLVSVTNNGKIAKPLLPISAEGKTQPMLYFILDKIKCLGSLVDEIVLLTNEKYYVQMRNACTDYDGVLPITVLSDGSTCPENMRGANGTLSIANDYIGDYEGDVLVLAGDNYFDFSLKDLVKFHKEKTQNNTSKIYNVNTVVSKRYPESDKAYIADKFGILNLEGQRVLALEEKPGINNIKSTNACLAVYLFNRQDFGLINNYMHAFESEPKMRDSLGYFINYIISKSKTYTYAFEGKFIDIGSPADYYSMNNGKTL